MRGIRVSAKQESDSTADGIYESSTTTEYLTDHENSTGYAQAVRETTRDGNGNITKTVDYTFGHDEISQTTRTYEGSGNVTSEETLVFGHDGHGSVRVLTDLAGAMAQFFTYDAYGQLQAIFNSSGSLNSGGNGTLADPTAALTSLLYSGESFDSRIGHSTFVPVGMMPQLAASIASIHSSGTQKIPKASTNTSTPMAIPSMASIRRDSTLSAVPLAQLESGR